MSLLSNRLTYLCNTVPNVEKMEHNLSRILPYVDGAVVCIGERNKEAEDRIKAFPNTTLVYFPWQDSFRDAYQACLNHAPKEGWHLRLDDDEVPDPGTLQYLRETANNPLVGEAYGVITFLGVSVIEGTRGLPYPREVFYKWCPSLHYEVDLHQALVGYAGPKYEYSLELFQHIKSRKEALSSECRDFFIAGVWADYEDGFTFWHRETGQDPRRVKRAGLEPEPNGIPFPLEDGFHIDAWHEMKDILARNHPEVRYYRDLDRLISSGRICREFIDWAKRHNSENDTRPHLNELHAFDEYITKYRG